MDLGYIHRNTDSGSNDVSSGYMGSHQISGAEHGKPIVICNPQRSNYDYCRIINRSAGFPVNHDWLPSTLTQISPATVAPHRPKSIDVNISSSSSSATDDHLHRIRSSADKQQMINSQSHEKCTKRDYQQIAMPSRVLKIQLANHHDPDSSPDKAAAPILHAMATTSDNYRSGVAESAIICCRNPKIDATDGDHDAATMAKIAAHPAYPRLVLAYLNCNKVGAPPDIAVQLEELSIKYRLLDNELQLSSTSSLGSKSICNQINGNCRHSTSVSGSPAATITGHNCNQTADPELDNFMEGYCNVLCRYHEELTRHFREAICFMNKIESKLNALVNDDDRGYHDTLNSDNMDVPILGNNDGFMHSSYQQFSNAGDYEEDVEAMKAQVKEQIRGKYSSYIASLKRDFLKKKKKGKLPKDARQKLLHWWDDHYKWPYPSEGEKVALAEATGLDPKQINNWFINQRKRHWKPSEDVDGYAEAVAEH